MSDKRICQECGWRGVASAVVTAPSPFHVNDTVQGCPRCFEIQTMRIACDSDGCWREMSSGTPTEAGYRMTCGEHRPRKTVCQT